MNIWQATPALVAVQWPQRLHWQNAAGAITVEAPEPVYLVAGQAPADEPGQLALAARLQADVLAVYRTLEGVARAWYE